MNKQTEDYNKIKGKAIIEHKTEINHYCSSYDPFGLCNILECLYCDNSAFVIYYENGDMIEKSDQELNQNINYYNIHEILFYDYVPKIEDIYSYIFDDDSKYKILRKFDNVVIVDTNKIKTFFKKKR